MTAPTSPFSELLRRSRFASFDPAITQAYFTPPSHHARGNWGIKRPLPVAKKNKKGRPAAGSRSKSNATAKSPSSSFISIPGPLSTHTEYTPWVNAEPQVRFIKKMEELPINPHVPGGSRWFAQCGTKNVLGGGLLDSEFCLPEESGTAAEEFSPMLAKVLASPRHTSATSELERTQVYLDLAMLGPEFDASEADPERMRALEEAERRAKLDELKAQGKTSKETRELRRAPYKHQVMEDHLNSLLPEIEEVEQEIESLDVEASDQEAGDSSIADGSMSNLKKFLEESLIEEYGERHGKKVFADWEKQSDAEMAAEQARWDALSEDERNAEIQKRDQEQKDRGIDDDDADLEFASQALNLLADGVGVQLDKTPEQVKIDQQREANGLSALPSPDPAFSDPLLLNAVRAPQSTPALEGYGLSGKGQYGKDRGIVTAPTPGSADAEMAAIFGGFDRDLSGSNLTDGIHAPSPFAGIKLPGAPSLDTKIAAGITPVAESLEDADEEAEELGSTSYAVGGQGLISPNIYAMSPREFQSYLKKLRAIRPQFLEYVERERQRRNQVAKVTGGNGGQASLEGKEMLELAQGDVEPGGYGGGFGHGFLGGLATVGQPQLHKGFLGEWTANGFADDGAASNAPKAIASRIEPRPHVNAGLTYTHFSPLHSHLFSRVEPAIILHSRFPPGSAQERAAIRDNYTSTVASTRFSAGGYGGVHKALPADQDIIDQADDIEPGAGGLPGATSRFAVAPADQREILVSFAGLVSSINARAINYRTIIPPPELPSPLVQAPLPPVSGEAQGADSLDLPPPPPPPKPKVRVGLFDPWQEKARAKRRVEREVETQRRINEANRQRRAATNLIMDPATQTAVDLAEYGVGSSSAAPAPLYPEEQEASRENDDKNLIKRSEILNSVAKLRFDPTRFVVTNMPHVVSGISLIHPPEPPTTAPESILDHVRMETRLTTDWFAPLPGQPSKEKKPFPGSPAWMCAPPPPPVEIQELPATSLSSPPSPSSWYSRGKPIGGVGQVGLGGYRPKTLSPNRLSPYSATHPYPPLPADDSGASQQETEAARIKRRQNHGRETVDRLRDMIVQPHASGNTGGI